MYDDAHGHRSIRGKVRDDGALQANALLAAWGVYYQTWLNDSTAY
jgi:hypothetical protein